MRGSGVAVGIYMTGDGMSYLKIERAWHGGLRVEGHFLFGFGPLSAPNRSSATYREGRLTVSDRLTRLYCVDPVREHTLTCRIVLEPSVENDGDWDGVDVTAGFRKHDGPLAKGYWEVLGASSGLGDFWQRATGTRDGRQQTPLRLTEKDPPLKAFLRRVDDESLVDYIQTRRATGSTSRTLAQSRQLADDHPANPLLALAHIEQESVAGNLDVARRLWEEWQTAHAAGADLLLRSVARNAYGSLTCGEMRADFPGLKHQMDIYEVGKPAVSTAVRRRWLANLLATDRLMLIAPPLTPVETGQHRAPTYSIGLERAWRDAQLDLASATLWALEGRIEEALTLLAANYRLGQSLADYRTIAGSLRTRRAALDGLELLMRNQVWNAEGLGLFWTLLERLGGAPDYPDRNALTLGDNIGVYALLYNSHWSMADAGDQHGIEDARFQALRVAVAAREHLLETGRLPQTASDLSGRFPAGLPADTFAEDGVPLQMMSTADACFVYSVGPNGVDDSRLFEEGEERSPPGRGDIALSISLTRKYPIPTGGVRANNAAELLAMFPNGLPPDPFADIHYQPLSILESSTTQPLVIFSYGPDAAPNEPPALPESSGASWTRRHQQVYQRAADNVYVEGQWLLAPMYDPTNGTPGSSSSNGDIFIEIPRRAE